MVMACLWNGYDRSRSLDDEHLQKDQTREASSEKIFYGGACSVFHLRTVTRLLIREAQNDNSVAATAGPRLFCFGCQISRYEKFDWLFHGATAHFSAPQL